MRCPFAHISAGMSPCGCGRSRRQCQSAWEAITRIYFATAFEERDFAWAEIELKNHYADFLCRSRSGLYVKYSITRLLAFVYRQRKKTRHRCWSSGMLPNFRSKIKSALVKKNKKRTPISYCAFAKSSHMYAAQSTPVLALPAAVRCDVGYACSHVYAIRAEPVAKTLLMPPINSKTLCYLPSPGAGEFSLP